MVFPWSLSDNKSPQVSRTLLSMLYSQEQLYIHICVQKYNDAIKTGRHGSLENIPLTLLKRVVCEREFETEQRLQHIEPPSLLATTAFLSRSPGLLNRGPGGSASTWTWFSFQHLLSN